MIAYKFLRSGPAGPVGPFSGFAWPVPGPDGPGPWVTAEPFRGACGGGVHACDADHLVDWLDRKLWLVELGGEIAVTPTKLIARRGRLLRRIAAWDGDLALALADAAVERARELAGAAADELARGYLADAILYRSLDVSASLFCAAHAALTPDGFARERVWQSRWLAARLGLAPAT